VDNIDLHIIQLLARDPRTPYRNIASAMGITSSAAKEYSLELVAVSFLVLKPTL